MINARGSISCQSCQARSLRQVARVLGEVCPAIEVKRAGFANVQRLALCRQPSVRVSARLRRSRASLVHQSGRLRPSQFPLLQVAVADYLEEDGEENEAEVGPSDKLPREAVQEADLVTDDWRWAGLLAEGASAIRDLVVAEEDTVGGNWILARDSFGDELTRSHSFCRREVDVRETVRSAVIPEEVEETDGTADACSSDKRRALARCVDRARVVVLNADLDVGVVEVDADSW